ncbi:hypothetical protein SEPCBS119000_005375 [Sporothrix epigloea]|uniref:Uncharacterized protein n=1 Tax=Sporothrix epigloea TaxID=1892477 RepID=A0ABP0DXF4_9PEZI
MAAIGPTDNDHEKLTMNGDVVGSNDSMDVGAESPDGDTQIATGDNCIVSCGPTSGLDESLLLPLPETIGAEGDNEIEATGDDYGWQSPTSAELERPMNVHDISHTPINPVVIAESLLSPSQIDIDTHFLSQDLDEVDDNDTAEDADCIDDTYDINIEDVQDLGDAADADDLEAEHASYTNKTGGHLSPAPAGEEEVDAEYTVTQPFNMFNVADEDATTTIAADIDAFTEDQQSVHEDSETEMLRKFVTRVKADKSAKAAAAADVPPCQSLAKLQRKRRTGSAGSAAFPTGSPKAKNEIAVILDSPFNLKPRVPFGEKDHNMSPSPKKMKKHAGNKLDNFDENRSCNLLSKPLLDDNSPPRPKRRRRKIEADTDAIFNPEFKAFSSEENSTVTTEPSPGPRRSKRTRSQLAVKTAASTADTTSALSLIPIRLPGSLNLSGEDGYGLSANSLGHRRNDEKELAAATRVNTRKNKGNADPPCIVVARESQKALGVLQSKEEDLLANDMDEDRASNLSEGQSASQREKDAPNKPAKIVRWAEALVRFQTADGEVEDKSAAFAGPVTVKPAVDTGLYIRSAMAGPARASGDVGDCEAPAEILTAEEPEVTSTAASATPCAPHTSCPANASEPKESLIPRRTTRVSRLQPPTPRKLLASAAAAKTAVSAAGPVTAPIAAPTEPAPMGLKALPSGSASARRMAATRAKIVGMGIAGNGTPAPKRRIARMA